jgi:protocatechuate 3,4-dioxygenase beta subunit
MSGPRTDLLRRRDAILALGGLGLGVALAACGGGSKTRATTRAAGSNAACVLTPEATDGPYYIAAELTRRDVTENQRGVPLRLELTVQDATSCRPIASADVEIWHANAQGAYSGFGEGGSSSRFLRGHQRSDARGTAVFDTVYPGWYQGRTPHIHLKVHVGGSVVHTGQLFFDDRTSAAVYGTSAYRSHGQADVTNATDSIYASAGAGRSKLKLSKRAGGGYTGAIALGVRS